MTNMSKRTLVAAGCVVLSTGIGLLAGCSTDTKLTAQEHAQIKGGPMPPEAQKEIARRNALVAQKMQQARPANASGPGAPAPANTGTAQ